MKNKGFTLIELLAVIIIIGLIAVITIPKINDSVEDSKRNLAKTSAYQYKKTVEEYLLQQKMELNNVKLNGTYGINNNGFLYNDNSTIEIGFNGEKPKNGFLTYIDNDLKSGCITLNKYAVTFQNGEVTNVEKGKCEEYIDFKGKYITANNTETHKGVVYLDPTNISNKCDETNYNSTPGTKTGCMKFYIFNENSDGTVDMILDHNTSLEIAWTKYKENDEYVNHKGPREAIYQLYEDTKDWDEIFTLTSSSNYTTKWTIDSSNYSYTIDYTKNLSAADSYEYAENPKPYKARFITAQEIASIIGMNNFTLNNSASPFFGSLNETAYKDQTEEEQTRQQSYSWLFENLDKCTSSGGCLIEPSSNSTGNYSYWTSSAITSLNGAWCVSNGGRLMKDIDYTDGLDGIRPVITIPKYIIEF